jgi:hypothetical protein
VNAHPIGNQKLLRFSANAKAARRDAELYFKRVALTSPDCHEQLL